MPRIVYQNQSLVYLKKNNSNDSLGWYRNGSGGWEEDPDKQYLSSSSSEIDTFSAPKKARKVEKPNSVIDNKGPIEVYRACHDNFFLGWHWGERLKIVEIGISEADTLPKSRRIGNLLCALVAVKFEKKSNYGSSCKSKFDSPYVKAFYFAESGDGLRTLDAQEELSRIANFSELVLLPGKLSSWLELLVSPAAR